MKTDLNLHHCSNRVTPGSLDFMTDLLPELGFVLAEKHPGGQAAWLYQRGQNFVLQFNETNQDPLPTRVKRNSQIAFISNTPKTELKKLKSWIRAKGVKVVEGTRSDREFYLDCPEVFVDFVVEIMPQSVAGIS